MKLTEKAIEQLKLVLLENNVPGNGIRISATKRCRGNSLRMDIEDEAFHGDKTINIEGIDFFIENDADKMIRPVIIDYTGVNFKMEGMPVSQGCF